MSLFWFHPSVKANSLLLMEPIKPGAYQRVLEKRGPGLHHLAIDVLHLEQYIESLAGSGWLLHPVSIKTMKQSQTAYLARPGFPGLIEVQERKELVETSYSGLELFRRYFALISLNSRVRRAFDGHGLSGDYSAVHLILIFIALWLVGGRRLRHIPFIAEDPLVQRLCGLKTLPSDRTVSRWLGQFTNDALQALIGLNSEIVTKKLRAWSWPE